jgi:hypothetical protein
VTDKPPPSPDGDRAPGLAPIDADDLDRAVETAVAHVAAALRAHMDEHGLGVRQVAKAAGLSPGTVVAVRDGTTRVEARVLARLETALGTSLWPAQP